MIDYLAGPAAGALQKISTELKGLEPELRSEKVVEVATALHALIPPYVVLRIKGESVIVPMRWLIPEDLFVQLIVALANGAADQVEVIRQQIEERYKQYRQDPAAVAAEQLREQQA